MAAASLHRSHDGILRVEFCWEGDRFAHVIQLETPTAAIPLLYSVEGGPADCWPPSPSLTQCDQVALSGERHAWALLGMAGSSHWSLSAEPTSAARGWMFDIACRLHKPASASREWLGSTYAPAPGWHASAEIAPRVARDAGAPLHSATAITPEAIPPGWLPVACLAPVGSVAAELGSSLMVVFALPPSGAGETTCHVLPSGQLQFAPAAPHDPTARTRRWRYLLALGSPRVG